MVSPVFKVQASTRAPSLARWAGSSGGKSVSAVVYENGDGVQRVRGDIVVLAAGAINSAAILLRSANGDHPNGLANGSDQVGRNYMFHTASASLSFAWPKIQTDFPKTMAINDFYWGDPDGKFPYPMGHIQMLGKSDVEMLREGGAGAFVHHRAEGRRPAAGAGA